METNIVFICNHKALDFNAIKELVKAWNLIGVDYKKCIFSDNPWDTSDEIAIAYVPIGTDYAEAMLGGPFRDLGRLETFAGQAFKRFDYETIIYPIYSPYICVSSTGATDFYRSVANFWNAVKNPIQLQDDFPASQTGPLQGYTPAYHHRHELGIDTEGTLAKPWSVQIYPDKQQFYFANEKAPIAGHSLIFHSGLHDAPIMEKLGYNIRVDDDTLLMAHHLDLPLGLKELTVRELGIILKPYSVMIEGILKERLIAYFNQVRDRPEFNVKEGRKHTPARRVTTLINNLNDEAPQAVYRKWNDKAHKELRLLIEAAIGEFEYPTLADIDFNVAKDYACKDPKATYLLKRKLAPRLQAIGAYSAYKTDVELIPIVNSMHSNGLPIDIGRVRELSAEVGALRDKYLIELRNILGADFNPNSAPDKLAALQSEGVVLTKKTESGKSFSVGKKILKGLGNTSQLAPLLYRFSEIDKLNSTYVPALTAFIGPDGRVHPTWRITSEVDDTLEIGKGGAATGRLTCSNPNVMAFPERTGEGLGKRFKKCFVAPEGWIFANADLDQIEMRMMAHMANCKAMIASIWAGRDSHTDTASLMFNVPYEQVDKAKHRFPAKTINFLMLFEGGAQKLVEQLAAEEVHIELDQAKKLIADWYSVYPEIREYQRIKHVEAELAGYVSDFWGRIRHTEGARAANRMSASEVMRQASNFPIQSGAQVLLKRAMVRIWNTMQLPMWKINVKIVAQIHDELVFLIKKGYESFMQDVVQVELVREQNLLLVPLSSSVGYGESWGDLK